MACDTACDTARGTGRGTGRGTALGAACVLLAALAGAACGARRSVVADVVPVRVAPTEDPLLDVARWDPRIRVRPVYATPDNFVGEALYPVPRVLLRRSLLVRLSRVADALQAEGFGLLVYDGYRPWAVTKRMWDLVGDPDFVADPRRGSRHNRGMAVDVTLVDLAGRALPMPTSFDAFLPEAAAAAEVPPPGRRNRDRLIAAMRAEGFEVLASEWWHFDAEGWRERDVLDVALPDVPTLSDAEATRAAFVGVSAGAGQMSAGAGQLSAGARQ
ncbi:MAG: M15 family metallopeptidase [Planctomycetota bacterium]